MKKTQTLSSLIESCRFDYVNENIKHLFNTEPIGEDIGIKNFGKYMTSEEVIAELKKEGLRPANATELFHYAATHPEEKNKYIVALGSVVSFEGESRVCDVWCVDSERDASLGWFGSGWGDGCWFAFGREGTQSSHPKTSALGPLELPLELRINNQLYRRV